MKFKHIDSLDAEQIRRAWRIIGIRHKKPYSQAQLREDGYWHILESKNYAPINREKHLKRIFTFSNMTEVLEYFHIKEFSPYCPHSDIVGDEQATPEISETSDTGEKRNKKRKNILHRRNKVRRKVSLTGELINKRSLKRHEILINDLSFDGAGFTPINDWDFKKGDIVSMTFTLNNRNEREIQRNMEVKHITNKKIGGEFVNKPRLDADLGFYLLFDVR